MSFPLLFVINLLLLWLLLITLFCFCYLYVNEALLHEALLHCMQFCISIFCIFQCFPNLLFFMRNLTWFSQTIVLLMCAIYVELQFCLRLLCQLEIKYSYQIQPNTQIMQQQKLSLLWKVSAKKGPYFFLDGKGVYQIKRHICNCCIIYIKTYLLFSPLFM